MPEYCTCGAELPPDARFCHKCGKPQGEQSMLAPEPEAPRAEPPPPPPAVSFRNPIAVRVGFTVASAAALLSWLPLVNLGFVIWWTLAGFFAVYLYRRRTGQQLSIRGGLQMGWITGMLTFAIMTVLFTASMVPLAAAKGGFSAVFQQQIRSMAQNDPNFEQAARLFQTPAGVATVLIFTLALFFAMIMFLCTAGAAVGAKLIGRGGSPRAGYTA
ncbi:MAG: zinc ribbon domain-containing protein [Bryobacteraceae bacterium]